MRNNLYIICRLIVLTRAKLWIFVSHLMRIFGSINIQFFFPKKKIINIFCWMEFGKWNLFLIHTIDKAKHKTPYGLQIATISMHQKIMNAPIKSIGSSQPNEDSLTGKFWLCCKCWLIFNIIWLFSLKWTQWSHFNLKNKTFSYFSKLISNCMSVVWKITNELAIRSRQVNFSSIFDHFSRHDQWNAIVWIRMWKCVTLWNNIQFCFHPNRYFCWVKKFH